MWQEDVASEKTAQRLPLSHPSPARKRVGSEELWWLLAPEHGVMCWLRRSFSVCGAVFSQLPAGCTLAVMEVAGQKAHFFTLVCSWAPAPGKWQGDFQCCGLTHRAPVRDNPSSTEQGNMASFPYRGERKLCFSKNPCPRQGCPTAAI